MHNHKISEIRITYLPEIPVDEMLVLQSSKACYSLFMSCWNLDTIQYEERFAVMYLNRSNRILGIHHHSVGGIFKATVDTRQILGIALKCNACSFILCHNHPGGSKIPSRHDRKLTEKIRKAASLIDLVLLDHLIITRDGYCSFTDEGLL